MKIQDVKYRVLLKSGQKVYLADRGFRGREFDLFLIKKQIKFSASKKIYPIYSADLRKPIPKAIQNAEMLNVEVGALILVGHR